LLKQIWIRSFERRNLAEASAVHVTSPLEREELMALGLTARRFVEVPNGVELGVGVPGAPLSGLPARYALFLGRISWKKGLDRLVAALAHAPEVPLVVAGNDDEDYWSHVASLASAAGVASRVHRLGFVEGEEKRRLLVNAKLLVLSSYSENFGNVVLEAMAHGVPVVVTREVGLASLVETTGAGVIAPGEPKGLGEAIARLAADPARHRIGEKGRRAAEEYSWARIAGRMEAAYGEVIAESTRLSA
jgi:glycosyltransferase involved in cell wall biosynthesis